MLYISSRNILKYQQLTLENCLDILMVFIYTVALSVVSILLVNEYQAAYIYLFSFLLTAYYYFQLSTDISVTFTSRLRNGELIHQLLFIAWMYFFPQN